MSQKTIILTVILFALIVIGMFTYARIRSHEVSELPGQGLGLIPV